MLTKQEIIEKSVELGFGDIGFTTADPFNKQREILEARKKEYAWAKGAGIDLMEGIDPKTTFHKVKSIIVLLATYFGQSFPPSLEAHFGRCYLDDDRMTRDGLSRKVKAFRVFLRDNGIDSRIPGNIPQRIAAARAGVGTFGKNCLLYAKNTAYKSSWIVIIPILVDQVFEPDDPNEEIGCPDWCRNACIIACPTGALKGPRKIDPYKCISYLSYLGEGLTPKELREPMGVWVYGCDKCQNVCPRNDAWKVKHKLPNEKVIEKEKDFQLPKLLHMDKRYFRTKIWPHMFYMSFKDMWRWKMNVARAMGNSMDAKYIPDLIRAFEENKDERIKGMIVWALGKLGGPEAKKALEQFRDNADGIVLEEINDTLLRFG